MVIGLILELRELWGLDPRVSMSHTLVFKHKRGFGGKCLPKDVDAIIMSASQQGYRPEFLKAIKAVNTCFRQLSAGGDRAREVTDSSFQPDQG